MISMFINVICLSIINELMISQVSCKYKGGYIQAD